jgi:integrase
MGLGPFPLVSLAEARAARDDAHRLLRSGIDPIDHRRAELESRRVVQPKSMTFQDAARGLIKDREAGWRNAMHRHQWTASLEDHVFPLIGNTPVRAIDTAAVMRVLQQPIKVEAGSLPLWEARPETASRLRGRIEAILNWAKVHGYRDGENPARWRGHLENQLPKKSKLAKIVPYAAVDYRQIGAVVAALRVEGDPVAHALEFLILTASRTGEVLGARWDEIDLDNRMWTVPGSRMKAGRAHRVPLSPAAMAILEAERLQARGELVFMNFSGEPLWPGALLMRLKRMGDHTVHGMRAAFRTWAAERTSYATECIELSLAHNVGSKVEVAYQRSDLFDRRRQLMDAWAAYCNTTAAPTENVLQLRAAS